MRTATKARVRVRRTVETAMRTGASVCGWAWSGKTPGGGFAAGTLTRVAGSIAVDMISGYFRCFFLSFFQEVYRVMD